MARRLLSLAATAVGVLLLSHGTDAYHNTDRFTTNRDVLSSRGSHINILASGVEEAFFEEAYVDNLTPITQQKRKTWKQRYLIDQQYWGGKGYPVFFYNGAEGPLSQWVLTTSTFMGQLAQKHKALLVGLEHRFYGDSKPTADLSLDSLRYLSSEQHLADVARFHAYLTKKMGLDGSKWVSFGGSYGGSLAAWVKLKYPSLFVGAVASSAPLQAKVNFFEYNEVVGRSLRYFGGDACYNRVKEGFDGFRKLVDGGDATKSELQRLFPACDPIQNNLDLSVYESELMYGIQSAVQYDGLLTPGIRDVCTQFADTTKSSVEVLSSFTLRQLSRCIDSTFEGTPGGLVEYFRDTREGTARQWFYQTCKEFGWYQTPTSPNSPFYALSAVTEVSMGTELCKRAFNLDVQANVRRTNSIYGGLDLTVENVTFVSGSIDPWSAASVVNTTHLNSASSVAVYIEGTSHCADLYGSSSTDIPALTAARNKIAANVAKYIGAQP